MEDSGATVDGPPLNALNDRRSRSRRPLASVAGGLADMADFVSGSGIEHVVRQCNLPLADREQKLPICRHFHLGDAPNDVTHCEVTARHALHRCRVPSAVGNQRGRSLIVESPASGALDYGMFSRDYLPWP